MADRRTDLFQCPDHVLSPVAESGTEHRHIAGERIDDRQHSDLLACRELIVNEVHGPYVVRADGFLTVVPQLCLYPRFGVLFPALAAGAAVGRGGTGVAASKTSLTCVPHLTLTKLPHPIST